MTEKWYVLRISLEEAEPEIWRRFVVPAWITLDRLHDVIQLVMGWNDSHLHNFTIGKKIYTERPEYEEDGLDSGQYRLGDLVKKKGQMFQYSYDFGDGWDHELVLEDSNFPGRNLTVTCLDGALACPPDDVGGMGGYCRFCEAIKDPNNPEHEMYMEWCGGGWDSERFDVDVLNYELMLYLRWSRDRVSKSGINGTECFQLAMLP